MNDKHSGTNTKAVHEACGFNEHTGAVMPPVFLTSTFEHGNAAGMDYTRSGNPNFVLLDQVVAALEGADFCTSFGSGVSAITAVVSSLKNGDKILAEENIYGCTYRLFDQVFKKFGLSVDYVDLSVLTNLEVLKRQDYTLIWVESPTNPLLKILDLASLCAEARRQGVPVIVDNTFASPVLQRPLELGATLSLNSTTKYINGHSDCLSGTVSTNDAEWHEKMIFAQKALGLQPSPFDAWLTTRGVKTLGLRMERHSKNALALADWLEAQDAFKSVRYPFLKSHPQYDIAIKQMSSGSGLIVVELDADAETAKTFCKALNYFTLAESLGGVESLICHPASMTHASIPASVRESVGIHDGTIRLSVGIEDLEDLKADLKQALELIR